MIYITGSNGFVGKNLISFLKKKKKKYVKIRRSKICNNINSNYRYLPKIIDKKNNILIHLSSPSLVRLYRKKNNTLKMASYCLKNELGNASSLIEYCKRNKFQKLIYMSTSSIYGPRKYKAPFTEKSNPNPKNDYSKIKLKVENFIKKEFKNTIIVRPFQIYGKYDNPKRLIPTLVKAKKNKKLILQSCLQATDLIHVNDLCQAIYNILNSKINDGTYNLGSGEPIKLRDIVEIIHNQKNQLFSFTYKKTLTSKINNYCYADINLAKNVFKWSPKVFFNKNSIKSIEI